MNTPVRRRKVDRELLAIVVKKNAEDLMMALCGRGYTRAYNPTCPPKRRGRSAS